MIYSTFQFNLTWKKWLNCFIVFEKARKEKKLIHHINLYFHFVVFSSIHVYSSCRSARNVVFERIITVQFLKLIFYMSGVCCYTPLAFKCVRNLHTDDTKKCFLRKFHLRVYPNIIYFPWYKNIAYHKIPTNILKYFLQLLLVSMKIVALPWNKLLFIALLEDHKTDQRWSNKVACLVLLFPLCVHIFLL